MTLLFDINKKQANINGVFYCSCYASPRLSFEEFTHMVDRMKAELANRQPVVIADDFDAWAVEWGSRCTNQKGQLLLESLAALNVELANVSTVSTFRRNGAESIFDATLCSPNLSDTMNWRVDDGYTHSDHQSIRFAIQSNLYESMFHYSISTHGTILNSKIMVTMMVPSNRSS